ncbi:hypothetical protein [Agromyces larvae]|uniref:Uncharacterized protein n=1 Tax=Agromyces larvae TaxID=2929802 RepID=A0ABY4C006_9MICO|nr:hypothetical protein [Agromyces larvae]UOE44499.1 hypothetical protein MTO99_01520 [Agromyces larvae]
MTVNGGIKIKGVTFQIGSHLTGTLITIIRDEARSRPDYTKPREDRPRL